MEYAVDSLLSRRQEEVTRRRRWPTVVSSMVLHLAVVGVALLAPLVAARGQPRPEYVAVQIIPASALGVQTPGPEQPQPSRAEPPPERPAEPQVELVPEPEPEREKPLPAPDARLTKPEAKPERRPAPAAPAETTAQRRGSPSGSPVGTTAGGPAVAGFEGGDFTYGYYVDQMLSSIRANWVRPPLGGVIEAIVHFRIHRNGEVTDIRIVVSSGYNSFDLAGLRAVQAAAPLPPLPASYRHDALGVNLILR